MIKQWKSRAICKRYFVMLAAWVSLMFVSTAFAQVKPIRVFVIGNSFSQNATTYLPQLAKEGKYELEMGKAELGSCSLQTHWELAAAYEANPQGNKGRPYQGKSLRELLSNGKWDIVTIQQYSRLSGDSATYQPYADSLVKYIKAIQPATKIVVHQTWAYRRDAINWGMVSRTQKAGNDEEMYRSLTKSYQRLASHIRTTVIPTGNAFWIMRINKKWGFKSVTINTDSLVYPVLPPQVHSINVGYKWDQNKKLVFDPNHANTAGCYLGSLVWFHYLFGNKLSKVKFKPSEIDEEFAVQLKKAATRAFKDVRL